jgi:hypothetical protein
MNVKRTVATILIAGALANTYGQEIAYEAATRGDTTTLKALIHAGPQIPNQKDDDGNIAQRLQKL